MKIQPTNNLLNAVFVRGSLDAGAVSMENTSSCPHGAYMLVEETEKQIDDI